jgi:hypothetical protein
MGVTKARRQQKSLDVSPGCGTVFSMPNVERKRRHTKAAPISIRLPRDVVEALNALADQHGRPRSVIMENFVKSMLNHYEQEFGPIISKPN